MTTEEIIEGNKLIAEFMGDYTKGTNVSFNLSCTPNDFKYHSSWDWLIPVVEKIHSLGYTYEICNNSCRIKYEDRGWWKCSSTIESVYRAVVEFIKWYNEQKEK